MDNSRFALGGLFMGGAIGYPAEAQEQAPWTQPDPQSADKLF